MKHHVSKKYYWEFNGVKIQGIVEYVGTEGMITSKFPHARCKEPRQGDFVDLREWNEAHGHDTSGLSYRDFGVIDNLNWLDDGDVHICTGGASVYLGRMKDPDRVYVSISGGPFSLFYQDDLEPTMELLEGRFWNFRDGFPSGDNGQDYYIKRPVFKLNPNPRKYVFKEIDYDKQGE